MQPPFWLRLFLHRRGWLASPSLAFSGVPFGPDKRDLAGEVMRDIAAATSGEPCPMCGPDKACPFEEPLARP